MILRRVYIICHGNEDADSRSSAPLETERSRSPCDSVH